MGILIYCIASFFLFSTFCEGLPIESSQRCDQRGDIIFAVDTSSSISSKDFNIHVKKFLKEIISSFNIGPGPLDSRVGVLLFGSKEYLQFHLNRYKNVNDTLRAVDNIVHKGGYTYTHKALEYTMKFMLNPSNGARSDVAKIIIVLTDGKSTYARNTLAAAQQIKNKGVNIFAVGVGGSVDSKELNSMASSPSEQYVFRVTDFRAMDSIKKRFTKTTCEVMLTTKTTTKGATTGAKENTTPTPTPTTTEFDYEVPEIIVN